MVKHEHGQGGSRRYARWADLKVGLSRQRAFVGEGSALVAHALLKRAINKQTPITNLHRHALTLMIWMPMKFLTVPWLWNIAGSTAAVPAAAAAAAQTSRCLLGELHCTNLCQVNQSRWAHLAAKANAVWEGSKVVTAVLEVLIGSCWRVDEDFWQQLKQETGEVACMWATDMHQDLTLQQRLIILAQDSVNRISANGWAYAFASMKFDYAWVKTCIWETWKPLNNWVNHAFATRGAATSWGN